MIDLGIKLLLCATGFLVVAHLVLGWLLPDGPPLYRGLTEEPEDWPDDDEA